MYDLGLEAFLAVVRTRNMSRAAAQLNLSQPTISKRIKVLEQQIESNLIERGNGIKLTPSGEALVELAERWDALKKQLENFHSVSPQLSLSIGTNHTTLNSFFPLLYNKLSQHQPKIKLSVTESHSADLYDSIERRQIDVAFCLLDKVHPMVKVEKCYVEPMVVLRRDDIDQPTSKFVHPHDLDCNNELYGRWGAFFQIWHDKWWDAYCSGRHNVPLNLLVPALLNNAEKWAIVPLSFARNVLANNPLSMFYLSEAPPERVVYKITHKEPKAIVLQSLDVFNRYLDMVLQEYQGMGSQ